MAKTTTQPDEFAIAGRRFRVFYDRAARVWTVLELNAAGDQIGDAQYSPTRDLALVYIGMTAAAPAAEGR